MVTEQLSRLRMTSRSSSTARPIAALIAMKWLNTTASAVRGVRSTPGVGAVALQLVPGTQSADELLASVESGIFVQALSGLHSGVNAISGDFSVGVEGLMIRDGALAEPVREATLGSTIQRLLTDIVAVGSDLEWLPGGYGAATLVLDGLMLSGA